MMRKCSCTNNGELEGKGRIRGASWWIGACVAVGLILFAVHRPSLHAPFYFDSMLHLQEKTNLHMQELSLESLRQAVHLDRDSPRLYRPLSGLTLAFTYYYAGLNPAAYRVGNIVIHFLASLSLLFLLSGVLRAPRILRRYPLRPEDHWPTAFLAMALWSLHPVHTNVVSYVIQRMTSLSGLFVFLAVGAYLRLRTRGGWPWGLLLVSSSILAVAAKENGALLPCYFLLAEWLLLDGPLTRCARFALAVSWAAVLSGALALAWFKGPALWATVQYGYSQRPFSMGERLLTQAAVQIRYLTLLLVPDPRLLTIDADIPISRNLLQPPGTLAGLALILLALLLSLLWSRKKPLISLAIAWFLTAQLMESTFLALELYFEHRLYVPAALLFLPVAHWAVTAARSRRATIAVFASGAIFLGVEAWATHYRTTFWASPILLYDDIVAKSPRKPRAYENLSHWLMEYGRYDEADAVLHKALTISGPTEHVLFNLGVLAYHRGQGEEARAKMAAVVEKDGELAWRALRNLAYDALTRGEVGQAGALVAQALARESENSYLWLLQGRVLGARGDLAGARAALGKAVRYDPLNAEAWSVLAVVAKEQGDAGEALRFSQRARQLEAREGGAGTGTIFQGAARGSGLR